MKLSSKTRKDLQLIVMILAVIIALISIRLLFPDWILSTWLTNLFDISTQVTEPSQDLITDVWNYTSWYLFQGPGDELVSELPTIFAGAILIGIFVYGGSILWKRFRH